MCGRYSLDEDIAMAQRLRQACLTCLVLLLAAAGALAQQVQVQELILDNGMKVLLVPRKGDPNVAAGWVAKVGAVNERPGITGISHLFEHMMFKGTRTIGTSNIDEDLRLQAKMDQVKGQIRVEEQDQLRRLRTGEIADIRDPKTRTPKHQQWLDELAGLEKAQRDILVKNEFDRVYTTAGASGMNAGTSNDFTVYYINVPSNKLELWFWMESDRLANPVFREFYSERDVVREERRLRTESTPTGKFQEEFEAMFWSASPYHWPVVGWPSDVEAITREEALAYFDLNYAPNNLTACLVGDFDPANAKTLAQQYFGRLKRNPQDPPPVRTREVEPQAEKRMLAYAETNPQAVARYHTVATGHKDEAALKVLEGLLTGRTGRLYKSLVLDQKVATNASAGGNAQKWEGYFQLSATAAPGKTPEMAEQALYKEIEKLQSTKADARELQKIKNQYSAGTIRRLQNNFGLMLQLLLADNTLGWKSFNEEPAQIQAVTAEDVQRVATTYFKPERRAVILYYTKAAAAGAAETDPLLEGLSDAEKAQARQARAMIQQMPVEQAKQMLQQLEQAEGSAPPERQKVLKVLKSILQQKIGKGE
jgi:predicted Zn-dependent peptidase